MNASEVRASAVILPRASSTVPTTSTGTAGSSPCPSPMFTAAAAAGSSSSSIAGDPRALHNSSSTGIATPWAAVPKELQGGYRTIQNQDFSVKKPYEKPADGDDVLTSDIIKKRWQAELRRRREVEDEKTFEARRALSRMLDVQLEEKFRPQTEVQVFDHKGTYRRAISAPLEEFQAHLDRLSVQEAELREKVPVTPAPPHMGFDGSMYWYPHDRQTLKYRVLEEARMKAGRDELQSLGWAVSAKPGGPPKRLGKPHEVGIGCPFGQNEVVPRSAEEEAAFEEKWRQFCASQKANAERGEEEENSAGGEQQPAADCDPSEAMQRAVINRTMGAPLTEEQLKLFELLQDIPADRAANCRPDEPYRAELPGNILPTRLQFPPGNLKNGVDVRPAPPWGRQNVDEERWRRRAQYALEELKRMEAEEAATGGNGKSHHFLASTNRILESLTQVGGSGAEPPTSSTSVPGDATNSAGPLRGAVGRLRPLVKGDVDRELKVVRDGGLLRRPRESVVKRIGEEAYTFVKSLPKDFGKKGQQPAQAVLKTSGRTNHAPKHAEPLLIVQPKTMKPVPTPGASTLK